VIVDPRQRSSDRRYFKALSAYALVGVGFCLVPLLFWLAGADVWDSQSGRRGLPPIVGLFVGVGLLVFCLGDLMRRWFKGSDRPGKRARF
jgi:hypothetical protein